MNILDSQFSSAEMNVPFNLVPKLRGKHYELINSRNH